MTTRTERAELPENPLWYKDAIIYEVHVRGFYDSDGDGIGDFNGLTEKLDYLQDLGVTALWLLPFYPSPLLDDGYDIADYTDIHPSYGTLRDFRRFLRAAHDRGMRVITELVLNHTSDQHPWFQRARRAKLGSRWRNFYVWSDTPERYEDARIIFRDFESSNWSWDPVANAYYWHRFYSHQPDLNYDSPDVRKAICRVVDFWLGMGVDGLRLDAVPYLFEREGTTGENLPRTHAALRRLRRYIDERYQDRMLLAEANQWPEEAAAYFGDGDECHMAFHFPLMPRLFMSVQMEDRFPILDIMEQTPPIPENAQWALFLRNHDELTLEMVTDEERLYMYRTYARDQEARINLGIRRRLAPLLGNNRRRIELMNALLLSLNGTPVLYYGDEIGMGDNIYLGDRDGVRTPMQWSADRNAGFSQANPQQLYLPLVADHQYHYETIHVESQQTNSSSLLRWTQRLLALRKRYKAFGRGAIEFLRPENTKILAFIRRYEDEQILVVANLSRFAQYVQLDLAEFAGQEPQEMFGRTRFPVVGETPYPLALAPHSFYWFSLNPQPNRADADSAAPLIPLSGEWSQVVRGEQKAQLEDALPRYLARHHWFACRGSPILNTTLLESIEVPDGDDTAYLLLLQVSFAEGEPAIYALPLACADGSAGDAIAREHPHALIARIERDDGAPLVLYDALWSDAFVAALARVVGASGKLKGLHGSGAGRSSAALREALKRPRAARRSATLEDSHNNTAVVLGNDIILKLYRSIDIGVNPDLEISEYLTRHAFPHTPLFLGALEYRDGQTEPVTLALLQRYIPNSVDGWERATEALEAFREGAGDRAAAVPCEPHCAATFRHLAEAGAPELEARLGSFCGWLELLGRRTAELHLALAGDDQADFAPIPFTQLYQRSRYQAIRSLIGRTFRALRRRLDDLPAPARADAEAILASGDWLLEHYHALSRRKIDALRIRCHGDYRLRQVLWAEDDILIFDFEGERERPIGERRLKRSPLSDVASMLRSFYAVAYEYCLRCADGANQPGVEPWAQEWALASSTVFLRSYFAALDGSDLLPPDPEAIDLLLDSSMLEKGIYEIGADLVRNPDHLGCSLHNLRQSLAR